jgi:aspartoacylase
MNANQIKRVAIVGGTHGNEFIGVYLIKKFARFPNSIERDTFETMTLLANPKAFAARRRYIDRDLNRCFSRQDLANLQLANYEDIQAKAIAQLLGPKENPQVDAIIDLHSTTANMGLTVILPDEHPFNLRLAAYLTTIDPLVKVYCWSQPRQDSSYLRSLCQFGCVIEVGPIAQGTVSATLFQQTERLIHATLDYLDAFNRGQALSIPSEIAIYRGLKTIDYPRDSSGELQAMIHPQLQLKDYQPLNPGEPMLLTFDGETIVYQGRSTVFPVFINEAAYYEKGIAMCLTEKHQVKIIRNS